MPLDLPLLPHISGQYQLGDHPDQVGNPDRVILFGPDGAPASGKIIVIGEAEAQGNVAMAAGKGTVLESPNGTKYRVTVDDAGNISSEAV